MCVGSLHGLFCEKVVNLQPVYEGIEPAITGSVRIAKTETVAAVLVEVELDRYARFVPGINHPELTAEEKIISGNNIKHGWSVLGHLHWAHPAIDGTDEGKFHGLGVECCVHGEASAGRESDHAYSASIHTPLPCPFENHGV